MTDYIRREDALFALRKAERGGSMTALTRLERAYAEIREMPAANVAEVVHGQWDDSGRYIFPSGDTAVRCTECGCALTESEYRLQNWNYCPVCGARMDGGVERGK